jgi:hypothetical protein
MPPEDGHHQPLAFYSGSFVDAQKSWSTAVKEGFAIMQVWRKGGYLSHGHQVHVYTDHRNFGYIFAGVGKVAANSPRLQRWASELSGYDFVVHHIQGIRHVWADMLTRCMGPSTLTARKCLGRACQNEALSTSTEPVPLSPDDNCCKIRTRADGLGTNYYIK